MIQTLHSRLNHGLPQINGFHGFLGEMLSATLRVNL